MIEPKIARVPDVVRVPGLPDTAQAGSRTVKRTIHEDSDAVRDETPVILPRSLYRPIDLRYWLAAIALGALAWFVLLRLL